jgi:hypothetical protein
MDSTVVLLSFCGLLFLWATYVAARSLLGGCSVSPAAVLVMLGLAFGFGPWLALVKSDSGTLPAFAIEPLIMAYVGLFCFCAGLLLASRYGPKSPGIAVVVRKTLYSGATIPPGIVFLGFAVTMAIRMFLAVKYKILLPTANQPELEAEMKSNPYWVIILSQYTKFFLLGYFGWATVNFCRPGARTMSRWLAVFILISEAPLIFCEGRRELMQHGFYFTLGYFAVARTFREVRTAALFASVVGLLMITVVAPVFLVFRTNYGINIASTHDTADAVKLTLENMLDSNNLIEEATETSDENLADRTLLVRFNIEIADAQTSIGLMWGRALWNSALGAIPGGLLPNKASWYVSEILIREHYRLKDAEVDVASNWAAFGMADFNLPGCFLYGILLGTVLARIETFSLDVVKRNPLLGLCIVVNVLDLALSVESEPIKFLVATRNAGALLLLASLYRALHPSSRATKAVD